MERDRPGFHTLIRQQIASETEVEKLAREQSGSPGTSSARLKPR